MMYQREAAVKIAALIKLLPPKNEDGSAHEGLHPKQRQWIESMFYILNKHWERVDNFRIDKFLNLVRNLFNTLF